MDRFYPHALGQVTGHWRVDPPVCGMPTRRSQQRRIPKPQWISRARRCGCFILRISTCRLISGSSVPGALRIASKTAPPLSSRLSSSKSVITYAYKILKGQPSLHKKISFIISCTAALRLVLLSCQKQVKNFGFQKTLRILPPAHNHPMCR